MSATPSACTADGVPPLSSPPQQHQRLRGEAAPTDTSSSVDRWVMLLSAAIVFAMAILGPLAYISKEVGIGIGETALTLAKHGIVRARKSPLGTAWPFSLLTEKLFLELFPPKPMMPWERPSHDEDGVPIEKLSGRRVPDLMAEAETVLAQYAADPSYTRFEDSAIFFRVLPRRVRVSPVTGKPLPQRHLYQLYGSTRGRLAEARQQLREEAAAASRQRERARQEHGEAGVKKLLADSYGMAEIDPVTNNLFSDSVVHNHTSSASPLPVPIGCVHPASDIYGDTIELVAKGGYVIENTYLAHVEDPYDLMSFPIDSPRPCVQRILPMMCIGDKWEVICPLNMTSTVEKLPFRVLVFRIEIRDLSGPVASLAAARAALARGVFMRADDVHGSAEEGDGGVFTREKLLARAKISPPRIKL